MNTNEVKKGDVINAIYRGRMITATVSRVNKKSVQAYWSFIGGWQTQLIKLENILSCNDNQL